jgi:CheY-like chemotaxis protein
MVGSAFSLQLPLTRSIAPELVGVRQVGPSTIELPRIADDRGRIQKGDKVVLIVESDEILAKRLLRRARDNGLLGLVAVDAASALATAHSLRPDAITMNVTLPDMDGWVLLDRLTHDPETRHLPIHLSGTDDRRAARRAGAVGVLGRHLPADLEPHFVAVRQHLERKTATVDIVAEDSDELRRLVELTRSTAVDLRPFASGTELALDGRNNADCLVIGQSIAAFEALIRGVAERSPETVVLVVRPAGADVSAYSDLLVKFVGSPEHLLAEFTMHVHQDESTLPDERRSMLHRVRHCEPCLAQKRVLVVDDDVRNLFAIAAVLEQHRMIPCFAENGKEALEKLRTEAAVDVVLMDIMMPVMDGYDAMRAIRADACWGKIPIIALTAKAMKGDREKCIDAGATDYVTKPVEAAQLISLLRTRLNAIAVAGRHR